MADVKCSANYCSMAELPFGIHCSLIEKDLFLLFGPFQSDSMWLGSFLVLSPILGLCQAPKEQEAPAAQLVPPVTPF